MPRLRIRTTTDGRAKPTFAGDTGFHEEVKRRVRGAPTRVWYVGNGDDVDHHEQVAMIGRILIIDDDDDIRETVSYIFEAAGYQTLTAANGQQARPPGP